MSNILHLLTMLSMLFPLILAQEFPIKPPGNIKLTPPNMSPESNMITRNLDWHKGMASAFVTSELGMLHNWGSFDTPFYDGPQFYTINLYKFGEGGYESPSDCYFACKEWLGQAIGAGMQQFQCDHYGGGTTHCWIGYAPKVDTKTKREWKA
ncbi:MAG: hypothetical protein M1812_002945 [Candelaria pacifica]|nr:MAG: hypothetical protein M1812_002945 [Candelaria pacifica]